MQAINQLKQRKRQIIIELGKGAGGVNDITLNIDSLNHKISHLVKQILKK